MEAVRIEGLNYRYPDGTTALRKISLVVERGESLAILGPNGAGKTTLLSHINGLLKPQEGVVRIFGEDVRKAKGFAGKVGLVFQDPDDQLFMPTVFDDLAFGPMNLGYKEELVREKVKEALTQVGLSGFEERCPHHLSFGEKRKVCIAAVLSMEPEILVLDEFTSNLDPRSKSEIIKLLKSLNEGGKTVIVATHDVGTAAELAERVYILNKTIIMEGKTGKIFQTPQVLREQNLDVPEIARLFHSLKELGYHTDGLPLSVEEAVRYLAKRQT